MVFPDDCRMISRLHKPWEDRQLLAMLASYEDELHGIDPSYPRGRTITFLDVPGIRTFVDVRDDDYAGFIVVEIKDDCCEIHELYVTPRRRNGAVLKALQACSHLVFNVFKKNTRVVAPADSLLRKSGIESARSDRYIWGVDAWHYELKSSSIVRHCNPS